MASALLSGVNSYPLTDAIPSNAAIGATALSPVYLRVDRAGDLWTVDYSTDGTTWTNAGSFFQALAVTQIGIYGGNAGGASAPAHTAQFDYFFDVSNPVAPEDNCNSDSCAGIGTGIVNASICPGDSILTGGAWQKVAGNYYDTLTAANACDSIVQTILTLLPINDPACNTASCIATLDTVLMMICNGDSIFLEGEYRNPGGIFYDTLVSVLDCDSVICSQLSVGQSLEIIALDLVDAPPGSLITSLTSGYTIVKSALGSFSIDAILCGSLVKSVVFEVNGSVIQTENVAPYAINGDKSGLFKDWDPAPGPYVIKAVPYSGNSGSGLAGIPFTVNITVVQSAPVADCNGDVGVPLI